MSPFDKGAIGDQPSEAFNDAADYITPERIKALCGPQTYCKPPPNLPDTSITSDWRSQPPLTEPPKRTVTRVTSDWRSPPPLNKTQKELRKEKPPIPFSQQVRYFIGAVLNIF